MGSEERYEEAKDRYLSREPERLRRDADDPLHRRSELHDRDARQSVRVVETSQLSPDELTSLRTLLDEAWVGEEAFDETDWQHALGGTHFLMEVEGTVRSHVSVVERVLEAGGRAMGTGFVEAVATRREDRGNGHASRLIREANTLIDARYELGALGTGLFRFYGRLGWEPWRGPTGVRTGAGVDRTPDEDGFIMVLRTSRTPSDLDLGALLTCDWRPGDVW
ncbi:MAG TPA: GNAT family N-acetyltransferase [Actinomycetota bacterium]